MSQVIDDRNEDWFKFVMEAIGKASGGRNSVSEAVSSELKDKAEPRSDGERT